ncbi:MAG TPA: 3-isopropylmalate dehydratase large subunit [Armatimonadetes bacterium]|jgi:3-isopropylmalate/(R)-2-methylmalate dehydratase large subunit|nr:3-isopropylmalate dehydratase large subunit [Armatimonadota bacterium]
MSISEKLLARAAGVDAVRPGEFVTCKLDLVLANDITAPIAIDQFYEMGGREVFDRDKITLVADHSTPNKDIKSAQLVKKMRDFAAVQGLPNYFEGGGCGIEHILIPDEGLALPGDVIIGADSHTCTYGAVGAFSTGVGSTDAGAAMATGETWFRVPAGLKFVIEGSLGKWVGGKDIILYTIGQIGVDGALYKSMEFAGSAVRNLPMADRFTICNMAIEAGGKNGVIAPDATTEEYVKPRATRAYEMLASDEGADYEQVFAWKAEDIEPQISFPHLPENARGLSEVGEVNIDQAVVGACTNGRLEDLRIAAGVLSGRTVARGVRCIIIPGSHDIHLQATREGLVETFLSAGCMVSTPTCGPCLGGHMGVLADGERAIATTNRNFVGRMGHPGSEVYLANPAIAAASAVAGKICGPDDL